MALFSDKGLNLVKAYYNQNNKDIARSSFPPCKQTSNAFPQPPPSQRSRRKKVFLRPKRLAHCPLTRKKLSWASLRSKQHPKTSKYLIKSRVQHTNHYFNFVSLVSTLRVFMRIVTWNRDSHGLFDYESRDRDRAQQEFQSNTGALIQRNTLGEVTLENPFSQREKLIQR